MFLEFSWNFRGKDAGGEQQFLYLRARETLSEVLSFRFLAYFDDSGMSLTIEQVVTQLQQEAITLKA